MIKKMLLNKTRYKGLSAAIIFAILLFALLIRLFRTYSGLPYLYHWDEPQIASNALQMLKTGSFNPHFYSYGTLTIYINYLIDVLHYLYLMGQPEGARAFLNSIWDIKTVWDTKWHWTISHPTFYYMNRIVSTVFGAATVLMVYLIGNQLFTFRWASLIAAFSIAAIGVHVSASAIISPDIPAAFFITATVLFSLMFIDIRRTRYFVSALILSGCAVATKYNSALVLIVPAVSLVVVYFNNRSEFKSIWLGMLLGIPLVTFFVCMPYALLDSAQFLSGMGSELRHYKVQGHPGAMSEPGWQHAVFQMKQFQDNIGNVGLLIFCIGVLNVVRVPKLHLILLLLIIYFIYMVQMKVNFHRNFIWFYPFIALFYGSACELIFVIGRKIEHKFSMPIATRFCVLINCIIVLLFCSTAWSEMSNSLIIKATKDSRTLIIDKLDKLNGNKIYIADELRIHNQDLRRLSTPHQIMKLSDMYSCPSKVSDGFLVVPSQIWMMYPSADDKKMVASTTEKLNSIAKNKIVLRENPSGGGTSLDIYTINPEILVIDGALFADCEK
jgi:hypothetical protein